MKNIVFFGSGHGIPEYHRMLGYFDRLQDSGTLYDIEIAGEVPSPSESREEFLDTIGRYFPGDDVLKNILIDKISLGNLTVIRAMGNEFDPELLRALNNIIERYEMSSAFYDFTICKE